MKAITGKHFFILSIAIALYFVFLLCNAYLFEFNFVGLGVVQEVFTLPLLLLQIFVLAVSFLRIRKNKFSISDYNVWSFFILLTCSLFTIGSFFNQ